MADPRRVANAIFEYLEIFHSHQRRGEECCSAAPAPVSSTITRLDGRRAERGVREWRQLAVIAMCSETHCCASSAFQCSISPRSGSHNRTRQRDSSLLAVRSEDAGVTGRRGLQVVLSAIGVVATVAGSSAVVQGSANVLQGGKVSANVDSEFRFYASWYAMFGLVLLRAARRPESETVIVRACGAGFLVAASSRLLSMKATGPPHALFKTLTVIEFVVPAVIIPWQTKIAAGPARRRLCRCRDAARKT